MLIAGVEVGTGTHVRLNPHGEPTPTTCSTPAGRHGEGSLQRCRRRSARCGGTRRRSGGRALEWQGRFLYFHPDEIEVRPSREGARRRHRQHLPRRRRLRRRGRQALDSRRFPTMCASRNLDFGIRGVHLSYELLDDYDALILIDAMPLGEAPGDGRASSPIGRRPAGLTPAIDAHSMNPSSCSASWPTWVATSRESSSSAANRDDRRGYRPVGTGAAAVGPAVDDGSPGPRRTSIPLHRRSCNRDPQARLHSAARGCRHGHREVPARSRPLPQNS